MPDMPYNYNRPERGPLERAVKAAGLPPNTCGEFMWMCEQPKGVHKYKNCATRGYAILSPNIDEQMAASRVIFARDDGRWGHEPK